MEERQKLIRDVQNLARYVDYTDVLTIVDFIENDRKRVIPLLEKCHDVLYKHSQGGYQHNKKLIKALRETIETLTNAGVAK